MTQPAKKIELTVFAPNAKAVTAENFIVREWRIEIVKDGHRLLTCSTESGAKFEFSLGAGWTVATKTT